MVQCLVIGLLGCNGAFSPEVTVQDYKRAFNSHSVDSLMSLYSDDVVFMIPDLMMNLSGITNLRGVAEYDSVLNTTMMLSDLSVTGDTVFCSIEETNDWMKLVGISSAFYHNAMFVVKEGKVTHIEADVSDSSLSDFRNVLGSFLHWAKQHHPNELELLMPAGIFQFSAASAMLFIDLLREWKSSSQ